VQDEDEPLGHAAATKPGSVSVTPSGTSLDSADVIVAVVANGTAHTVYVEDMHTACSIAVLERQQAGDTWEPLAYCGAERLPLVLAVGAGRGRTVSIDPAILDAAGFALTAGTYRLSVGWRSAAQPAGVVEESVHSAAFQID